MTSISKNSDNSTDNLLFPVAVAHQITTTQSGFLSLKFDIVDFASSSIEEKSMASKS
jgi:hypothetical protein